MRRTRGWCEQHRSSGCLIEIDYFVNRSSQITTQYVWLPYWMIDDAGKEITVELLCCGLNRIWRMMVRMVALLAPAGLSAFARLFLLRSMVLVQYSAAINNFLKALGEGRRRRGNCLAFRGPNRRVITRDKASTPPSLSQKIVFKRQSFKHVCFLMKKQFCL